MSEKYTKNVVSGFKLLIAPGSVGAGVSIHLTGRFPGKILE
jgi:hypothetical protein